MYNLKEAVQCILNAEDIAISCHINPDGDSIGSVLSLGLGLEKLGKRVHMISRDGVPKIYRALPGADRIIKRAKGSVDLAIAVDCSSREMLGGTYEIFEKAMRILEIDHHEFRTNFGDISLVDYRASAVGELVYRLLRGLKLDISKDIAQNILTSIIVETNSFRLPNIRPFTFNICARLLKTGVDFYKITELVYWSKRKEAVVLSGICMSRARFLKRGRIMWSKITIKDFDKIKGKDEDVDSVANEMLSIKGVDTAILFRERGKNLLRVSLRSKGRVNIAKVARDYGGGGHFDSAGCLIRNNKNAAAQLLNSVKNLLEKP